MARKLIQHLIFSHVFFFCRRLFTQVSVKYFNPHVPIRAVNWENPFYLFHFVTLYIDKCIVHVHVPVKQRVACNLFSFWPNLRRYCRWWQLERIFDCIFVCWIFQLLNGFDILADSETNRQRLKPLRKFCLANSFSLNCVPGGTSELRRSRYLTAAERHFILNCCNR